MVIRGSTVMGGFGLYGNCWQKMGLLSRCMLFEDVMIV